MRKKLEKENHASLEKPDDGNFGATFCNVGFTAAVDEVRDCLAHSSDEHEGLSDDDLRLPRSRVEDDDFGTSSDAGIIESNFASDVQDALNKLPCFDIILEDTYTSFAAMNYDVHRIAAMSECTASIANCVEIQSTARAVVSELTVAAKNWERIAYTDDCLGGADNHRGRCLPRTLTSFTGQDLSEWSCGPYWAIEDGNRMLEPLGLKLTRVPRSSVLLDGCYVLHKQNHFRGLSIKETQSVRMLIDDTSTRFIDRVEHADIILSLIHISEPTRPY